MIRSAKALAERLIVKAGAGVLGRRRHRHDVLVLAYHNILPTGEPISGDTSLHLAEREFARQLDLLNQTHDVVPLSSALDEHKQHRRPRAVITFDDAYVGAVTVGVRSLVSRGMPATIFVAPGILSQHTWWDLLANPLDAAVPQYLRDRFLTEFKGRGRAILDHAGSSAREPLSGAARIASEADVTLAANQPGITIGSHTWSHPNLQAMVRSEIDDELQRSATWLRDRYSSFIPWLAYPYGLYGVLAEQAAAAAGFTGALHVDGGWIRGARPENQFALPRINIPSGVSGDGFRLRVDGIIP